MFGISGFELLLIIVAALVFFGPDKLPEFGRTVGKAINTFKRAQDDMERVLRAEMYASDKPAPEVEADVTKVADATAATRAAAIWASDEDEEEEEE